MSVELHEVRLEGIPLDLQRETQEITDALIREFELIRHSPHAEGSLPARLVALVEELSGRFDAFTSEPREQLEAALGSNEQTVDLRYRIPVEAGEAATRLADLLDEADVYCEAGEHLVTLAAPERVRNYRRWFLRQFPEQIAGGPARRYDPDHAEQAAVVAVAPVPLGPAEDGGGNELWPTAVRGDEATIALRGDLDIANSPTLRDHLTALHAAGARHFRFDGSGITFIDSVGLSVILAIYRRCAEEGGTVTLVDPSPVIRRTLEISGLLDVLNVA